MNIAQRQEVERKIVTRVVTDLLNAGFELSVNNGGDEDEIPFTTDRDVVLNTMFATDSEHLFARKDEPHHRYVFFVYGNDGYDVIADYNYTLSDIMDPIHEWVEGGMVEPVTTQNV
jgi:hypothetical protein